MLRKLCLSYYEEGKTYVAKHEEYPLELATRWPWWEPLGRKVEK